MKHLFLDMDGTVTESRSKVSEEMKKVLKQCEDVVVISGAHEEQMTYQLDGLNCVLMSQNGNINPFYTRLLTEDEIGKILSHITLYAGEPKEDTIENRGAQISFSFVGHHAPLEKKKMFDPTGDVRRKVLEPLPLPDSIEAKIAGTASVDYFPKGRHKGYNIRKFIELKGWNAEDCLYIGDSLFAGGNDETVIGVIPTHQVSGPDDTLRLLKRSLLPPPPQA